MGSTLDVRPISVAEHLAHVEERASGGATVSYLQCPSWAGVKPGWRSESIGWFDGPRLRGVALVSYREVPAVGALAYLGEGPALDWSDLGVAAVTAPLVAHLRSRRAFTVRMTPSVVLHRWYAGQLRAVVRAGTGGRLRDLPPDEVDETGAGIVRQLQQLGWRRYEAPTAGFGGRMHPRYRAHVPFGAGEPADFLDASWRRNLRRADASGVVVRTGGAADLEAFHRIYVETAVRDGFAPLPLAYFRRLWQQLQAEDPARVELYLASQDDTVHAAALATRVGRTVSYVYGASTAAGRSARPSNAMQWRMLCDAARVAGAHYDLRGISDTLDPRDPLFGLLRFKLGLGADAVELVGEWELALRPLRHRAVAAYLDRRG
ncbi:peptidoglycan bridge formation glycyltransferase FemY [soil metagenome]